MDAILFDLDGTLLDSKGTIMRCLNATIAEYDGEPFEDSELNKLIGIGLANILELKGLRRHEVADRYREIQLETYKQDLKWYDGVPELLESLDSAKLGVVTMRMGKMAHEIMNGLGLAHHFEVITGWDDVTWPKPDKDHVRTACIELGVGPSSSVMVGDTKYDVLSANDAGSTSIGVTWGMGTVESLKEAGAHHLVDSIDELAILLKRL